MPWGDGAEARLAPSSPGPLQTGEDKPMFDSLDETIKHDAVAGNSQAERIIRVTVVTVVSILLFSGLYLAIRMLE